MLTKIARRAFDRLDDDELGAACAETLIEAYKEVGGRGGNVQTEIFSLLSPGQQALFLFRIYYQHVIRSADDFSWWTSYFLPQKNVWSGIKNALHFFGDTDVVSLMEELERAGAARHEQVHTDFLDESSTDLYTDSELQQLFSRSYTKFHRLSPGVLRSVAIYIRSHPEQFVAFL